MNQEKNAVMAIINWIGVIIVVSILGEVVLVICKAPIEVMALIALPSVIGTGLGILGAAWQTESKSKPTAETPKTTEPTGDEHRPA